MISKRLKENIRQILGAIILSSLTSIAIAGERTVVAAKSDGDYGALRAEAVARGARIVKEIPEIGVFVVNADASAKAAIGASVHADSIGRDRLVRIIPKNMAAEFYGAKQPNPLLAKRLNTNAGGSGSTVVGPDPANALTGLLWNLDRVGAPDAWKVTEGNRGVTVGVADTGLDYTHPELAARVNSVVDLTTTEDPPICSTYYGASDSDLSATYGGPVDTDWNGHGSWIGGNIAASLDGQGINGIAPTIGLTALKISQWCGSAYDSTILEAFVYAANHGIDIVSISFGGYLDRSDPEQDAAYRQYVSAVRYARQRGTIIVAAAGNEHTRIGEGGRVLSHGTLTFAGDPVSDYYGYYEVPGGVPGVIDVAATGNLVNEPSATCAPGTGGSLATCKSASEPHQPFGVGARDQLTYYSNYGPRIDIAAPGGGRKFNIPNIDGGGTPGWPVTDTDGFNAWEDFSITSNWAFEIPCYLLDGPFYANSCYSTIQGTSMATPHVSATLALIASARPELRHRPDKLVSALLNSARPVEGNQTPPLSATDTSPGDLTGVPCRDQSGQTTTSGYCHLGGEAIDDREAYGAGIVNARRAVSRR